MAEILAEKRVVLPTLNQVVEVDPITEDVVEEVIDVLPVADAIQTEALLRQTETEIESGISQNELEAQVALAKQSAYEEGYEKGLLDGQSSYDPALAEKNEQKSKQLQQQYDQMSELIKSLAGVHEDMIAENKDVLLEVVFEAVCKIAYGVVKDEQYIKDCILQFMSSERIQQYYKVEVAESDYAYLSEETELLDKLPTNFEIIPSAKVSSGFIVSSQSGRLDARTDGSLENFRQLLLQHQTHQITDLS